MLAPVGSTTEPEPVVETRAEPVVPVPSEPVVVTPPPAPAPSPEPAPRPPPGPVFVDLPRLTNEQLWARGNAGGPDVGIPARVAALEELLRRSLSNEERVRALKTLAFQSRASIEPSTKRQIEALEEAIRLAGPESPDGHEASIQLVWPLWESVRRDEAVETARRVATSPAAKPVHRGLAEWALMVFALERKDLPSAEEHFAALLEVKDSKLVSTQTLARQRIAAARARR
jgi:hypothetical protein